MNSQSQINMRAYAGEQARSLCRHSAVAAERIATHYLGMTALAQHLRKVCEMRRHSEPSEEVDQVVKMIVQQIKDHHWHDFGIELEWPEDSA